MFHKHTLFGVSCEKGVCQFTLILKIPIPALPNLTVVSILENYDGAGVNGRIIFNFLSFDKKTAGKLNVSVVHTCTMVKNLGEYLGIFPQQSFTRFFWHVID